MRFCVFLKLCNRFTEKGWLKVLFVWHFSIIFVTVGFDGALRHQIRKTCWINETFIDGNEQDKMDKDLKQRT